MKSTVVLGTSRKVNGKLRINVKQKPECPRINFPFKYLAIPEGSSAAAWLPNPR